MNTTSRLAAPILGPSLLGALVSCGGGAPPGVLLSTDPVLTSGAVNNLGQPLICNNRATPVEFGFLHLDDPRSVRVSLVGVTARKRQGITVTGTTFSNGVGRVTLPLPARTAPLSVGTGTLEQQGIVVSPNVIGSPEPEMQGISSTGITRTLTGTTVPVVDNCG